jgi:hypothetical protein
MFKEYFDKKTTLDQAHAIYQKSMKLAANVSEESFYLSKLIDVIQNLQKKTEKFEKNQQKSENPLK